MKNRWLSGIMASLIFILVLAVFFVIAFYRSLERSVPSYDATFENQHIESNVSIYYDEFAAPHIEAKTISDLCYAQGFAHARERLWQMDFSRRVCEGTLSAVLGKETLEIDRFSRTIGFRRLSEEIWRHISKESTSRLILESYSKGVNAFLELTRNGKASLPVEFAVLQYEPEDWKPENSIGMAKLMAWVLNLSWHIDITMAEIALKLGREKANLLFPDYPDGKPTIVDSIFWKAHNSTKKPKSQTYKMNYYRPVEDQGHVLDVLQAFLHADKMYRDVFGWGDASHFGSNSWAVSGKNTSTGKAILANDPHLQFSAPTQWMDMHLFCQKEGLNVSGASLPGTPMIVLGKNDNIAWGLTNIMLDDCDFFLWKDRNTFTKTLGYKQVQETIYIKGSSEPYILNVHTIPNSVLISDEVMKSIKKTSSPVLKEAVVSIKWTGYEPSNEVATFYNLAKAKSWEEFREALKTFGAPGQNFLYVDVNGNIGYQAAALVPIRQNAKETGAVLLRNPLDSLDNWRGYVPFDELPSIYNPSSGFIVTANNRVAPKDYPYFLTSHWEPASRAERIIEHLEEPEPFSVAHFQVIQSDVTSPHVRDIMKIVLPILTTDASVKSMQTITYLKNWNFSFEKKSVAALIYTVFFNELLKNTFLDELGQSTFRNYLFSINVPTRAMYEVLHDSTKHGFFDDVNTPEIETKESIIVKSIVRATKAIALQLGEPKNWFWGDAHKLSAPHVFSRTALGNYFDLKAISTGGTNVTINNGEHKYQDSSITMSFPHILGPSSRRIIDFSKEDGSYLSILPGGNSGHVASKHYDDQLELWATDDYRIFQTRGISSKRWKKTELLP